MKKILKYTIAVVLMAFSAASCESFLDVDSKSAFDPNDVFSSYDLAEGSVLGIAEVFAETNSYRGRFLSWSGLNSDIEWYNTYKPTDEKYQIAGYSLLPNNGQLNLSNGPFPSMYTGIERANLIIENLRNLEGLKDKADMAYLLGEALTLRALLYYDVTKTWGDVPARFSSVDGSTIYVAKSSRDVIFKQILADLDEAIPYLPYPGATALTSRTDRINKVFAEGLYARIALLASGYAIRPDDGMIGTGDLGTVRLSNDPDLQKSVLYPKALEYLRDAIRSKSASLEDFETMWRNQSNLNNLTAGPGYESLYVIPFSAGRGRWNYTFAVRSEKSSYAGGAAVTRGGDAGPVPTMWFNYDPADTRRDITCVNWRWNADDEQELAGIQRWYFGKYRFEWMLGNNKYVGGNDDGVKPVVMRYADVLLMAAEIANELGYLTEAKEYFLPVRERAFKGNEEKAQEYVAAISGKDEMFNAIVDERAFEFCGEMLRKTDLIRWNLLKTKMDEAIADMKALRSLSGKYANVNGLDGDVYVQMDNDKVVVYGFSGENTTPKGDWTKKAGYFTKVQDNKAADTGLYDDLVEHGLYNADPIQHMFWPMFIDTMTNSQGAIKNDYGYDSI